MTTSPNDADALALTGVGPLAFVDTETTSLDHRLGEVWDVAVIRREPDGITTRYSGRWWPDLTGADPASLAMNRFYDRLPDGPDTVPVDTTMVSSPDDEDDPTATWHVGWTGPSPTTVADIARTVHTLTADATVVGINPGFDLLFLDRLLRRHNLPPRWSYRPVPVEVMAAGHLGVQPPYRSDDLLRAIGVNPDDFERHTALGDAALAEAAYDVLVDEVHTVSLDDVTVYVDGREVPGVVDFKVNLSEHDQASVDRLMASVDRRRAALDRAAGILDRTVRHLPAQEPIPSWLSGLLPLVRDLVIEAGGDPLLDPGLVHDAEAPTGSD